MTIDGLSSQAQGLIAVSDNDFYTEEYKKLILMHEIIHIILCAHATTIKNNTEDVIDSLSYGFIQAMKQNPWMKEFFV
jgi:Zn-dependent peptidase ImmA (M78 family)